MAENNLMEKIVSLCKRRGIVYQSSEIYGGLNGFWDWGPIGVELKNNIKASWWSKMVNQNSNIVGLDSSIITNPKVWEASGHLQKFADLMVDCTKCKKRFRADHLVEDLYKEEEGVMFSQDIDKIKKKLAGAKCPLCGAKLTPPRPFNLMLKTFIGPVEDKANEAYLRPETCQSIFVNFQLVKDSMRQKIPFGIAQIGKAFRNEVTPANFVFRSREFEQMELEFFVKPKEVDKWFDFWKEQRMAWYKELGMNPKNLKFREHQKDELSHYAAKANDIEYNYPFGWKELEGIANRTDYDLMHHSEHSNVDLRYFDEESGEWFFPYVIEPSVGVERSALAFLIDAYVEEEVPASTRGDSSTRGGKGETRVVLKLHKDLAPIKVAILPLSKDEKLSPLAQEVFDILKSEFRTQYDETQSIGKRYRRQDEIGTPFCVTIDFESLEDNAVTIRERDSMKQERIKIDELLAVLKDKFAN